MRVDPGFNPNGVIVAAFDLEGRSLPADQRPRSKSRPARAAACYPGSPRAAAATAVVRSAETRGATTSGWPTIPNGVRRMRCSIASAPAISRRSASRSWRDATSTIGVTPERGSGRHRQRTVRAQRRGGPEPRRAHVPGRTDAEFPGTVATSSSASPGTRNTPTSVRTMHRRFFSPTSQDPSPNRWLLALVRSNLDQSVATAAISRAAATIDPDIPPHHRQRSHADRRHAAARAADGEALPVLRRARGAARGDRPLRRDLYSVARRTNEIGVRMALGASHRDVAALILRETALLLGPGIALGLLLALPAASLARTLLFGLEPFDGPTFAAAAAAQCAIASGGQRIPGAARGQDRTDPGAQDRVTAR